MTIKVAIGIAIGFILNRAINHIKIRNDKKHCVYDNEIKGWHKL